MKSGNPVIEVIIETADDMRIYPAASEHSELVKMVNYIKQLAGFHAGGQFSINEYRQVIVPATNSLGDGEVGYYYAGEYLNDIILELDGETFSGKSIGSDGKSLKPGDSWSGKPRPGISYKLKAGAADIEFLVKIAPGREKICRLSKFVGLANARCTASKIAQVKGHAGGRFFINEYRAMFCPVRDRDFTEWQFIGCLEESDCWFPKWQPVMIGSDVPIKRDVVPNKSSFVQKQEAHSSMPKEQKSAKIETEKEYSPNVRIEDFLI